MNANGTQTSADLLTGEHVVLHLYRRGHWPPETLATLWQAMRQDGALAKVFWGVPFAEATPYPMQGDLVSFVKLFDPDPPARRDVLIAESQAHPGELVGAYWVDDYVAGVRAAGSVWYRRRYWGRPAREASLLATRYALEMYGVPAIFAYTPWENAARHAESVGFRQVARIPEYVQAEGVLRDMIILKCTKETVR